MSFTLSLAGCSILVQGPHVDALLVPGLGFSPFVDSVDEMAEAGVQLIIREGESVDALSEKDQVLNVFPYPALAATCSFSLAADGGYRFVMSPGPDSPAEFSRPVCMSYVMGSHEVRITPCAEIGALRFVLWFAASLLLTPLQLTFVHASTIVHRGQAVMFLGESGTGKSTHSRLWLRHIPDSHLLNDDSPLVGRSAAQRQGGGDSSDSTSRFDAFGTPWSGKTPCFVPRSFPLRAAVRLSQAPVNSIRRLSTVEAFAALQPSLPPALAQDDRYSALQVGILSSLLTSVPVYHLSCLPDADAARLCHQTIFHD